jgi:hypothetical protein
MTEGLPGNRETGFNQGNPFIMGITVQTFLGGKDIEAPRLYFAMVIVPHTATTIILSEVPQRRSPLRHAG